MKSRSHVGGLPRTFRLESRSHASPSVGDALLPSLWPHVSVELCLEDSMGSMVDLQFALRESSARCSRGFPRASRPIEVFV
jgi:hypothetical protein